MRKTFTIAIWKWHFLSPSNLHNSATRAPNELVAEPTVCPDIGETTIRRGCGRYTMSSNGHGL